MKTLANKLVMFAAGALVLGGIVYGQSASLKADVPFPFRVGKVTMPAGSYRLSADQNGGGVNVWLRNDAAHRTLVTLPAPFDSYSAGKARMMFVCNSDSCSLREIRTSVGSVRYPLPKSSETKNAGDRAQAASIVSIPLTNGE